MKYQILSQPFTDDPVYVVPSSIVAVEPVEGKGTVLHLFGGGSVCVSESPRVVLSLIGADTY